MMYYALILHPPLPRLAPVWSDCITFTQLSLPYSPYYSWWIYRWSQVMYTASTSHIHIYFDARSECRVNPSIRALTVAKHKVLDSGIIQFEKSIIFKKQIWEIVSPRIHILNNAMHSCNSYFFVSKCFFCAWLWGTVCVCDPFWLVMVTLGKIYKSVTGYCPPY